jgi:hypothetical protein
MNLVFFSISLSVTFLSGWLLLLPLQSIGEKQNLFWFKFFAGLPLGICVSSVASFAALCIFGMLSWIALLLSVLFCCLIACFWSRMRVMVNSAARTEEGSGEQNRRFQKVLTVLVFVVGTCCICTFISEALIHPHGGYDAQTIWNLHARFLYRGGLDWHRGFTAAVIWDKPDYPLLLPIFIAQLWLFLANDAAFVSAAVAFIFTTCTIAVLYFGLALSTNRGSATFALLTLLVSPYFFGLCGPSQLADVPISFFLLSATVFLSLADKAKNGSLLFCLAGICLASAIWTKNDGVVFAGAFFLSRTLILLRKGPASWFKNCLQIVAGMMPVTLATIFWKVRFAPVSQRFSSQSFETISSNLLNVSRHVQVGKTLLVETIYFGGWSVSMIFLCVAYKLCMNRQLTEGERLFSNTIGIALLITYLAYYPIFMLSYVQLDMDMASTLPRLLIQIYPSFLYWLFFTTVDPTRFNFRQTIFAYDRMQPTVRK